MVALKGRRNTGWRPCWVSTTSTQTNFVSNPTCLWQARSQSQHDKILSAVRQVAPFTLFCSFGTYSFPVCQQHPQLNKCSGFKSGQVLHGMEPIFARPSITANRGIWFGNAVPRACCHLELVNYPCCSLGSGALCLKTCDLRLRSTRRGTHPMLPPNRGAPEFPMSSLANTLSGAHIEHAQRISPALKNSLETGDSRRSSPLPFPALSLGRKKPKGICFCNRMSLR